MIWVVNFNSSVAHIYSYAPKENKLSLIESLINPSGHLKNSDLVMDRPGHYQTMHSTRGAYEPRSDPFEHELNNFTKTIAELLKKRLLIHQYKQLILCAPPHLGGLLLNNLDKQTKQTLLINIKKDFAELDPTQLTDYLKDNWWDIVRAKNRE